MSDEEMSRVMSRIGSIKTEKKSAASAANAVKALEALNTPEGRAKKAEAAKKRWANVTPEQRAERTEKMRSARLAKKQQAAEGVSAGQVEQSAEGLIEVTA